MSTPAPLRKRVHGGLRWVAASSAVNQITRAIAAVILARLLMPEDYGLAALVLVFASLVLVFSDLALGAAIVQRKSLSEEDRCTAFWISIGAGITFTILGVTLAGPIAVLFDQPDAEALCRVLSLSFIVASIAVTQEALLLRDMRFRSLELRQMGATLASGIAGIAVAAAGGGAWALIAQQLGAVIMATILILLLSDWRPSLRFSTASARSLASFSAYVVGQRLLFYVHRNADNFIVGRFVGTGALGAYAVAYNVMLAPFSKIGAPLQRVLWPAFAELQDQPERLAAGWLRVTRIMAMLAVPSLMGLVAVAPDFIPLVLGDQWRPAVELVQVLAWVGILQAIQSLNIDVLLARGRARAVFRYTLLFTIAHVVAFVIGVQWGVLGVAIAYTLSSTLVEPVLTVLTARAVGLHPWQFVRNLTGIFVAGGVMLAVLVLMRPVLIDAGVGELGRLVVLTALGALIFLPLALWRAPDVRFEVRSLLGGSAA